MHYKNKKVYINRTYTATTFVFALITTIVLSAAAGGVSYITMQRVDAQMSNNSSMTGSMMSSGSNMSMASNMMAIPAKAPQLNITTAAPPVSPATFKSLASQMHIDLINATTIAQKWVGSNSHAVSSMIGIQNGSPVYTIWIIDSNSGLHQIVVDPQNGKVVFANQPMSMTGPFS
jgi:hypothetical protein